MLWLEFGELRDSLSPLGRMRTTGEWALHVQCAWRICQSGSIVVGNRDFYYSTTGDPLDDWDAPGKSSFDTTAIALREAFSASPPYVTSISVDDVGGFSAILTRDYRLDVFPDKSKAGCEFWRLFQPGVEHSHFVFPVEGSSSL